MSQAVFEGAIVDFSVDDIPVPPMRQIYELWQSKRTGNQIPARSDFHPAEMKPILDGIHLIDVERNPLRFRARLVGTAVVEMVGAEFTGAYFDELPNMEVVLPRLEWITMERKPYLVIDQRLFWGRNDQYTRYHSIGMPLAEDGTNVDMLMFCFAQA